MPPVRAVPKSVNAVKAEVSETQVVESKPKGGVKRKMVVKEEVTTGENTDTDGTDTESNEVVPIKTKAKSKKDTYNKDTSAAFIKLLTPIYMKVLSSQRVMDQISRGLLEELHPEFEQFLEDNKSSDRKVKKAKVDPNMPKKPEPVYFAFLRDNKEEEMKKNGLTAGEKLNQHMAELWKNSAPEVRERYKKEREAAMDEYYIKKQTYDDNLAAQVANDVGTDTEKEAETATSAKAVRAKPTKGKTATPAAKKSKVTAAIKPVANGQASPKKPVAKESETTEDEVVVADEETIEEDQGDDDEEMGGNPSDDE